MLKRARLRSGETVLILGASGGVASAAVQLARLAGARVMATSSTAAKLRRAAELGADVVINHRQEDVETRVREETGGRGADVLVQTQGGGTWQPGLRSLRTGGRVVICAAMQGGEPPEDLGLIVWHQLEIIGSTGGTSLDFQEVMALFYAGRLHPAIDRRFSLAQAREAQEYFAAKTHFGKIVLVP
jgi:NADPH:quinone reductase-like Zn-dependent oxidoreductase